MVLGICVLSSGLACIRFGYDADRECYQGTYCTAAETMNETPNFLIRLGEALGPVGSLIVVLLLSFPKVIFASKSVSLTLAAGCGLRLSVFRASEAPGMLQTLP